MLFLWIGLGICEVLGLIFCFFGKKITFPILGVVAAVYAWYTFPEQFPAGTIGFLLLVLIAVLLTLLLHKLYRTGMFLVGAAIGAGAGLYLRGILMIPEEYRLYFVLGCAAVIGIAAAFSSDGFVAIATAFLGAIAMVLPVTFLIHEWGNWAAFMEEDLMESLILLRSIFSQDYLAAQGWIPAIAIAVLAVLGVVKQK